MSMIKLLRRLIVVAVLFTAHPLYAVQVDLVSAYQKALEYDARLGAAKADHLINKEEVGKARSQLRPSVRVNASRGRNATQYTNITGKTSSSYYNSVNYGVSVRQPLFNLSSLAGYKQAKAAVIKSDAELQNEQLNLIIRLTEAYCNALYAEDNLDFSLVHTKAAQEQLNQAKRRFDNGFGTITEINEAQASYDMALAESVEIVNSVEYNRRELENLTGVYPDELCKLVPEKLILVRPDPLSVDSWIELAHSRNHALASAHQDIQIAKRELQKQRASRYPTIDLVGGRNYSESENNYSIGAIYDTYSVSVQLSMPMYSGGFASASIRQAHAKWLKAGEQFNGKERAVESDIRKYYNNVITSIAQIHAYEQAVKSQDIALTGTKKGFLAGLRSNVDVLEAQRKLLSSRRDLAKSRYQYIINRMMLKQSSGTLVPGDIEEVNGWLGALKK
ncbi:MAG: TolC family outer membrane protein [Chlorobiaceae bacterium]|nr:TolC family outer membrane protein [Chlorobiaceae bacterium]